PFAEAPVVQMVRLLVKLIVPPVLLSTWMAVDEIGVPGMVPTVTVPLNVTLPVVFRWIRIPVPAVPVVPPPRFPEKVMAPPVLLTEPISTRKPVLEVMVPP